MSSFSSIENALKQAENDYTGYYTKQMVSKLGEMETKIAKVEAGVTGINRNIKKDSRKSTIALVATILTLLASIAALIFSIL